MDAKNVLDLQVSVAGLDAAARAFDEPPGVLGFQPAVYARDHVPAGQAADPGQWAKIFWSRRAHPGGDVNLHARIAGSANERLALLFRDWFRAHPEAIPAYASQVRERLPPALIQGQLFRVHSRSGVCVRIRHVD
jgi:GrpB-like predicted nucleotidyltransferase (UPF0157 family)